MPIITTPLIPKDRSGAINVVAIGRISTIHQDIENIEASHRYIQDYLRHIYQGPMKITLLGEQASGMLTERATIREAEDLVATGNVDLMIAEDLARIYRNPRHQYRFVQDCVDQGTRVICVGDNLDTSDENWEITMGAAALRHGLHIPDTRRRVRRTATHCFHKGGLVLKVKYGYRKLSAEEADSGNFASKGLRIARLSECTPVIREMKDRVLRGESYAAVADWLNAEGIEPGRYVGSRRWNGRLVVELLDAPLLSGTRTFRDTICRPVFKTGKHKPTKNDHPETEYYPELAHLTTDEHDAVRQEIARRRQPRSADSGKDHSRRNVPRSRTLWPGQAMRCSICGGLMYFAGKHLVCKNSLPRGERTCWNRVHVDAALTRRRVMGWLSDHLQNHGDCCESVVETIQQILQRADAPARHRRRKLDEQTATLERQAANLTEAIAEGGQLQILVEKLRRIQKSLEQARESRAAADAGAPVTAAVPSTEAIRLDLRKHLGRLAAESFDFANVLRRILPRFVIQPVQALDSGLIRPRAIGILRLSALGTANPASITENAAMDVPFTLELFEPPSHIQHVLSCDTLKREEPRLSLAQIAERLRINRMTVKRALDYGRRMRRVGAQDPYTEIHDLPTDASRWAPRRCGSRRGCPCSVETNTRITK